MKHKQIEKPQAGEYAPYFQHYLDSAPNDNVLEYLENQMSNTLSLLSTIDDTQGLYSYAEGKWSIKELLGHVIDTERIFCYRALRFARKDKTPLPGFDQDDYVKNANFNDQSLNRLKTDYELVRKNTVNLFNGFTDEMLVQSGISNNVKLTVRSIPYILAGHEAHHIKILHERYSIK